MAVYLVTGGAGFIGSHIVRALLRRGESVRVLDDLSTGKKENLADVLDEIEFLHGSITNEDDVKRALAGVDYVLHQAALASVPRSVAYPLATHDVNVNGTLLLLINSVRAAVKRFVFASSSAVYGDTETLPKREDMPVAPVSPYGASKVAGEAYCRAFYAVYGLPTVSLRYFNVFGPRQDPTSQYAAVIPRFISALLAGRPPTIFGDGQQARDFCYVSNVVEANLLACESAGAVGQTMNVACQRQHSLLELVDVLNSLIGTNIEPKFDAPRPGDIRFSLADISRARALLNYEPKVGFHEGLARTVMWYRGISVD